MDHIKAIEDALANPGLTHGEWVACGPSFGDPLPRYLNEVIRPDDADGGDTVARALEGMEADSSADMAYIAACHPEAIRSLLDRLREAEADARRYRHIRGASVTERNRLDHYSDSALDIAIDLAPKMAAMKETP